MKGRKSLPHACECELSWRPRASTCTNWAVREERDRRWLYRRLRAAGHRPGCRPRRCAPCMSSSSPVRSTSPIWTPPRCVASWPKAGGAAWPLASTPTSRARGPPRSVALDRMRATHPLAPALPVIRRLLVDDAADAGVVVAVTAADGTLLWVEGDRKACRKAERMNFVPGADWSERGAGTNAPGTALALDAELQIRGTEHFSRVVQPWNCTAVPVHDPATGALHRRHRPHRWDPGRVAADPRSGSRDRRRRRESSRLLAAQPSPPTPRRQPHV